LKSYPDWQKSVDSYKRVRNEYKVGFTGIQGFLILQLISEIIEILNQLVYG